MRIESRRLSLTAGLSALLALLLLVPAGDAEAQVWKPRGKPAAAAPVKKAKPKAKTAKPVKKVAAPADNESEPTASASKAEQSKAKKSGDGGGPIDLMAADEDDSPSNIAEKPAPKRDTKPTRDKVDKSVKASTAREEDSAPRRRREPAPDDTEVILVIDEG
jgi:hypothetical protein